MKQKSQLFTQAPPVQFTPEQQKWLANQLKQRTLTAETQNYHLFLTKDGQVIKIPKNPEYEKPENI